MKVEEMSEEYMTKLDCITQSNKILEKLNEIETQNGKLDEMLNGKLGLVNMVLEMRKDIKFIKKNGHMSGRDKAFVITGLIGGLSGIATAIITALNSAM